ncbi:MAG: hypothetical protein DLM61_21485, partial [Pseudonocardiales bacterium]
FHWLNLPRPGQRCGFDCCPSPRAGDPFWRSMALVCADAAGIAIGRFARFATAARCARCGAQRTPT